MVGGPICEIKIPVQELRLKMQGGLYAKGGVYAGRYGNVEPRLQIKCLEDIPSGPMSSMVMRIEITYGLTSSGEAVWGLMHRM